MGDPDINCTDMMWVGWAMRGEEIENINLFTPIKKFGYRVGWTEVEEGIRWINGNGKNTIKFF